MTNCSEGTLFPFFLFGGLRTATVNPEQGSLLWLSCHWATGQRYAFGGVSLPGCASCAQFGHVRAMCVTQKGILYHLQV